MPPATRATSPAGKAAPARRDEHGSAQRVARRIVSVLLVIAVANLLVFAVEAWWLVPLRVPSGSMRPTLRSGDRVAVDHRVHLDDLRRGDLVVFNVSRDAGRGYTWDELRSTPEGSDEGDRPDTRGEGITHGWFPARGSSTGHLVVKRVVGLPGEAIEAHAFVVAVDSTQRIDEPYATWRAEPSGFGQVTLGPDEIWVMGDERDDSRDSRNYGPVPASAIEGRVAFRYWPWSRRGKVD